VLTLFFLLLAVAAIGVVVAAVAVGRIGGGMADPTSSVPVRALPEGNLAPRDLDTLRFEVSFRGYRMQQVDAALDRLRTELARRDEENVQLLAELDAVSGQGLSGRCGGGEPSLEPAPDRGAAQP